MNGIVHPCTHPEGRPAPETEDEMMLEVFRYTDRVVSMARPRKVLMMAVDGVAPRAKMNQQRSRRFRAAQDARILAEEKERAIAEAESRGEMINDAIKGKKAWDTNVITPGTPFMDILAKSLRYWVAYKLNNDPGWKDLKIIISDASVPGEGEHKIMEFIRSQRSDATHDPNTSHCIYGLDADLIFLGLATHEPHFRILREDVFADDGKRKKPRSNNNNGGFDLMEEQRRLEEKQRAIEEEEFIPKPFIWLHVDILRQYLETELFVRGLPFKFDIERAIDDWVFMCFFVGNDFLPHMPSLDVRDNGIDILLNIWRKSLPSMGGYMTCDGDVDLKRVNIMMKSLGQQEDIIFRKKRDEEVRRLRNEKRRRLENEQRRGGKNGRDGQQQQQGPPPVPLSKNRGEKAPINPLDNMPLYSTSGESVGSTHMSNSDIVKNRNALNLANMANKTAAQELKAKLLLGESENGGGDEDSEMTETVETDSTADDINIGQKRKANDELPRQGNFEEEFDEPEDNIRLWSPGYRNRYYSNKFHVSEDDKQFRRGVVEKYIEGICWTLLYYYQGCPSWNWYYPYHYAPFAQDLVDLETIEVNFDHGEPFAPFEQLMSVLPADSCHTLPDVFHSLMSDENSSIIDFYPVDFPIDMNGKKMSWQGIALLPFIDEARLLKEVQALYPELTDHEKYRNSRRQEILLISGSNALYKDLKERLYDTSCSSVQFRSDIGQGLSGVVRRTQNIEPGQELIFPLNAGNMPNFDPDSSLTIDYYMPELTYKNKSMLLNGVKLLDPVLTEQDKETIQNGVRKNPFFQGRNRNVEYNSVKPEPIRTGVQRNGGYQYFAMNGVGRGNQGYQGGNQGYQGGYQGGNQGYQGGYQGGNGYQGGYQGGNGYQGGYQGGSGYQGGYQGGNQGYQGGYNQGGYQGGYNQGYQGGQGGYQGNQGNQGNQGYQGNQGRYGGYQGNQGNNQGGYQRNNQGGYQGNNQGGYQGNNGGYGKGYGGYQGGSNQGNNQGYRGGHSQSRGDYR